MGLIQFSTIKSAQYESQIRYPLHWKAGFSMKSEQVQVVWEYVIAH
jgi:hypothetical protein